MRSKIFITGCPRSGSTMLARLMTSFDETYVFNEEAPLLSLAGVNKFEGWDTPPQNVIAKRSQWSIYSEVLQDTKIASEKSILKRHNIKILNIVRDGRAVVRSMERAWGIYNPYLWMECVANALDDEVFTVKYEDILTEPDKAQKRIAKEFNLKAVYLFSEYPVFVPLGCFQTQDPKYALRPLGEIGEIRDWHKKRPNDIEYFEGLLRQLEYIR